MERYDSRFLVQTDYIFENVALVAPPGRRGQTVAETGVYCAIANGF
jgi:hypothetical protein